MRETFAPMVVTLLALIAGSGSVASVSGQVVVLEGAGDVALDRRLNRLLDDAPLVVSSHTTFARGDTVHGSVLVLDASLVHEGVITGDLVVVDGGAFVRPRSVVAGDVVNIGGGLYRSEIADIGGRVIDLPAAPYHVVREPDRIVIRATAAVSPLILDGFRGFHLPTYDRVNGVTAVWGATYEVPVRGRTVPALHAQAGWQTQRGDPTYAVDFTVRRSATSVQVGHERAWSTNERWIRGDVLNSLVYLWDGGDLRDYHEVERTWAQVRRSFADRSRRLQATVEVRGQTEDARSLVAGAPWFMWGSETRPNPEVDDGRTSSLIAGLELGWNGDRTRFEGRAEYEAARPWQAGDFRFDRVRGEGSWAMHAFSDHSLAIDFWLQGVIGDHPLPRQRWSFVGGTSTLHTLSLAEHAGDRVVFAQTRYIIPMPQRLALPLVGRPRLSLLHAAGMAWTDGADQAWHQEAGLQVDVLAFFVRYVVVPDDLRVGDFSIGLSSPIGRAFPWEG